MKLLVALLAVVLCGPAFAAEVSVKPSTDGEYIDISASTFVAADVSTAWQILTDYDRYADFLPDLHVSRVRERTGNAAVVEQRGDIRFLFLRQSVAVTLKVTETAPSTVTSVAIGGSFRELAGRYELAPVAGGVRIIYTGRLVPGDVVPAWLTAVVLRRNVERHFRGLAAEMARQAAYHRVAHGAAFAPQSN